MYLRRTTVEREPAALREIFLRLGHIYRERVPDARRAIAAYERVHGIEPDNREALQALSELYVAEGDAKQALPVTERLVALEPDARKRTAYRVRLGELLMRTGDLRRAGIELRRAVDGDPRNVAAVTALAQLLERARDVGGRRALLDHAAGLLRHDVERGELDVETLRALVALLELRERPRAAAAVADLVDGAPRGATPSRAAGAGRSLGLRRPEIDERSFPPGLPPGIRQLMRLVGPHLRPSGGELAQQLARHGVTRADRARPRRGAAPRRSTASGRSWRAGDFDLFVKTAADRVGAGADARRARLARRDHRRRADRPPGRRRGAVRGGARPCAWSRPTSTRLLAVPPEEAAALLVGHHPPVRPRLPAPRRARRAGRGETARVARLLPRKVKPPVMPFAIESAGPFDIAAASRRGARRRERDRPARVRRPAGRALRRPGGFRDARSAADLSPIVAHSGGARAAAFRASPTPTTTSPRRWSVASKVGSRDAAAPGFQAGDAA